MWYVCDVLYAVLYVCVCCFVVRGCAASRRYIYVFYCDVFSVVNVYLDHLKFCVVCIKGLMRSKHFWLFFFVYRQYINNNIMHLKFFKNSH